MSQSTYLSSKSEAYGGSQPGGRGNQLGVAIRKGNGNGTSYTTTSGTYTDIDPALNFTCIIPKGFVLVASFLGAIDFGLSVATYVGLVDVTLDGLGLGVLTEIAPTISQTFYVPFALQAVIVGDDKPHSIHPQFHNAVGPAAIYNVSPTQACSVIYRLEPSSIS